MECRSRGTGGNIRKGPRQSHRLQQQIGITRSHSNVLVWRRFWQLHCAPGVEVAGWGALGAMDGKGCQLACDSGAGEYFGDGLFEFAQD